MPWKKLLAWATGQIDEALRQKLEFVLEENRVYRALLDRHSPYWRLQDAERKVLAEKGKPLGKLLGEVITLVQPETPAQMASPLGCQQMGFFPPTEGQTGTAIRLGPDRKVGGAICPRESRLGL
jgi:hypothetical protein